MTDMQSTMVSLRELNTKLAFEISELRKKYAELEAKNIEVEAENTKLKQDKKEVEARFVNLEQRDREKTDLAKLKKKHDVSLIKEQNLRNRSNGYTSEQILLSQRENDVNIPTPVINQCIDRTSTDTNSKSSEDDILKQVENNSDNTSDDAEHRTSGSSDICQERDSRSSASHETNSSHFVTASGNDNQINLRCDGTSTSDITDDTSNFDVCQETKTQPEALITSAELARPRCASLICIENKSSEDIVIDEFIDLKEKESVSNMFVSEVSTNSSSQLQYIGSIGNGSAIPTTLNEIESQPSNTSFTFLYEKLSLIQRRNEIASEKQIDPESNALLANISDALLWKRIEKAKKLYKLFSAIGMGKICRIHFFSTDSISKMTNKDIQYIIDNVPFDYSIELKSLSSGSDNGNSGEKSEITITATLYKKKLEKAILVLNNEMNRMRTETEWRSEIWSQGS
ncbi:hypothetical protein Glove_226g3 [Diversispora epigaea]|uniref:Uncharacterized protein n=1 Tax=Diversispora epigaea TaxID=1348612 RepID=A0A397IMV6_9GLOM|nr:hypothetical protein Glove_226g3 [Diversispora epigaea]